MIIEVKVSEFKKKVARSLGVVQAKAIIPALSRVKLEVDGKGHAVMSASDLASSVIQSTDVTLKSTEPGTILLPAKMVDHMVGHLKGDAPLTISTEGNTIHLKAGNFKGKLAGLSVDQFPLIEAQPPIKYTLNREALVGVISKVEAAAPTKAGRHSVTSIQIESNATGLRAVASDGFRIAIADAPGAGGGEFTIQLPKSVLGLIKDIPNVNGVVSLAESETNFFFVAGDEQVLVRKPMTKFPPYQKALALANFKTSFKASVDDFKYVLEGVSATVDGKVPAVVLNADGTNVFLHATNEESNYSEETLITPVAGPAVTTKINPAFFNDFLGQAAGEVTVELIDTRSLIRLSNGANYRYLVMPLLPDTPKEQAAK